jgi:hypothetical protein
MSLIGDLVSTRYIEAASTLQQEEGIVSEVPGKKRCEDVLALCMTGEESELLGISDGIGLWDSSSVDVPVDRKRMHRPPKSDSQAQQPPSPHPPA